MSMIADKKRLESTKVIPKPKTYLQEPHIIFTGAEAKEAEVQEAAANDFSVEEVKGLAGLADQLYPELKLDKSKFEKKEDIYTALAESKRERFMTACLNELQVFKKQGSSDEENQQLLEFRMAKF